MSVKLTPVKASAVGLDILKVIADVPPGVIAFGVKVFVSVTDAGLTILAIRAPTE